MLICVFGGASKKIDKKYIDEGYSLSYKLAKRGHDLIYGGGSEGLMGAAARGFKDGGGKIHGVVPQFFIDGKMETLYDKCDKFTVTKDMTERKNLMEDECEAFIITPGGIGTYDELFEILTLKQLGRHDKAIAILNTDGYYDWMIKMMDDCVEKGFINEQCKKLIKYFTDTDELIKYLESYSPLDIEWQLLKKS